MSEPSMISVSWPPLQLGAAGWRYRLESIADQAEALVGRKVVSMQATAELALELFGLVWPAFGPETVAATARASLLLNLPVVLAAAPADQLQEISERLDSVWEAAQSDPAAAVATVPAPLLQRVQEPQARPGRKRAEPAPDPTAPLEPAPEPAPLPLPQRPAKPLRPASERMLQPAAKDRQREAGEQFGKGAKVSPDLGEAMPLPEPEPELFELPEPWRPSEPEPWPPMAEPEATPAPEPTPEAIAPTPPPPASWLSCGEVAELLGVGRGCVASWRRDGRLGVSGVDYVKHGRSIFFDPAVVEQLEAGRIPAGLDQLVAEVQAP